ncbi:MAG: hypothetical protein WCH10_06755 [bacterium]
MIKQLSRIFLFTLSLIFLSGCAVEHNVKLPESFWQDTSHKITVAKTKVVDKPALHKIGGQGLLDVAISAVATKQFSSHVEKTSLDWYSGLSQKFTVQLKRRNIFAQTHQVDVESKQKKNPGFFMQMGGNKVLLIELQRLGAIRSYYGFVPLNAPKAYCVLKGELINLEDKKVLWRHLVEIVEPVQGEWDQPPYYPNFTKALEVAIASAQEEIIDGFFSGH